MLTNSLGQQVATELAIFPIITHDVKHGLFRCLGTGFFIQAEGWFVSAKHVLVNKGKVLGNAMAVQRLDSDETVIRYITHLSVHPAADILIGKLGAMYDMNAKQVPTLASPPFILNCSLLTGKESVISFGYPNTQRHVEGTKSTFRFQGNWSSGEIQEYLAGGSPLVKNECYQSSLAVDHGTSGGPVFHNSEVIGVVSSAMTVEENAELLSFITPVRLLLDLPLISGDGRRVSVKQLIAEKAIEGKM
jgi:hypothetical protein